LEPEKLVKAEIDLKTHYFNFAQEESYHIATFHEVTSEIRKIVRMLQLA